MKTYVTDLVKKKKERERINLGGVKILPCFEF